MALRTPQKRELQQIVIPQRRDFTEQIMAVKGQSPLATGISTLGDVLGQALQRRNQLRQQAQSNKTTAEISGITGLPDTAYNMPPDQFEKAINLKAQMARASEQEKQIPIDLTADKKNIVLRGERSGKIQLQPVPELSPLKSKKSVGVMSDSGLNPAQDKLEKIHADRLSKIVGARTGGLGLQDSKVNQAIDLRNLVNQTYNPQTKTYDIPPSMHSELVLGLARLLSPSGTIGIELEQELKQKTAREGIANAITYLTGTPVAGPPQAVAKLFVDSIDRQGITSETLRDNYMKTLKGLRPSGLEQSRAERLEKNSFGSSFKSLRDESPDIVGNQLQSFPVSGQGFSSNRDKASSLRNKYGY